MEDVKTNDNDESTYYEDLERDKIIREQESQKKSALAQITELLENEERPLEVYDYQRQYQQGKIVIKLSFLAPKVSRSELLDILREET